MANTDTPYISKPAAPLVNPTTASVFLKVLPVVPNTTLTPQPAFVVYKCYSASPVQSGVSNNQQIVSIIVRASGRMTGGATTNFAPAIQYLGTSMTQVNAGVTAANNTTIGTLTAGAANTASGNWQMQANLVWDAASGQINGTYSGFLGSGGTMTNTAATAITPITGAVLLPPPANVAGSILNTGELQLFFAVTGLFSASNANNVCYLDAFGVETL